MKKNTIYTGLWGAAAAVVALTSLIVPSVPARAVPLIRLEAGSVLPVRLNDRLSSNECRRGDSFTATIRTDESADGYAGLPAGTTIEGIVRGCTPQRDREPGVLELAFQRLRLPDGRAYALDGSLIGLDSKSVSRDPDGRLIAKTAHKNDRLTYVGYGAGAGLIAGLLTKHPLEDLAIGGGLGYLFGALQKGHSDVRDVVLSPGTEFGVRLDHQLTLADYGSRHDDAWYTSHRGGGGDNWQGRSDIAVMVDDANVRFPYNARPEIVDDVVMVPLIPVLEAAHMPFNLSSDRTAIYARGDHGSCRLVVGSRLASMNGNRRVRLDAPVQRLHGTIYVPIKALSLMTDQDANYESDTRTVMLTSRPR